MADLASALARVTEAGAGSAPLVFNTDIVRRAWEDRVRAARQARRAARRAAENAAPDGLKVMDSTDPEDDMMFSYVHQLWTDHIVVSMDSPGPGSWLSVPYTVRAPGADTSDVSFGTPVRVKEVYVAASASSPLDRIVAAAAAGDGAVAMSAPPWVNKTSDKKTASDSSSSSAGSGGSSAPGGLKLKSDPTMPPTSKAIVNPQGKRVGVVKQNGGKWGHSQDNYAQKFDSAEAAMRVFAVKNKASDGAGNGKADGEGKTASKPNPFVKSGDSGGASDKGSGSKKPNPFAKS